ncbi:MAG: CocE/NonD family hydrolase [Chitinophagales bacterium]
MKKVFPLILFCFAIHSNGQNFYFPASYAADSSTLSKNIPGLAKQLIAVYQDNDKANYYDNRFRLEMVAGEYQPAIEDLNSARNLMSPSDSLGAKGIGFQYESYISAKEMQMEMKIPFSEAYPHEFTRLYNALPSQAIQEASSIFDFDLKNGHDDFYKLLNNRKGKDSISLEDGRKLCRTYNMYNVFSQSVPLAKPILAGLENKNFNIEDSVLVTTRDGAQIAVVVVRKRDAAEKLPSIFVFNIYNNPRDKATAKNAAVNGYAGVVANTRGKRLSPQEVEPFEHDANDAYDIIDWISKQPWSNGKVGMYGGSYLGFAQWAAAKKVHPALKTIVPQVAVGIGVDYPMQNSVFMSYMLRWIHYVTNSKETDQAEFNNSNHWDSVFTRWYSSGKSFRSLDTVEGRPNRIFQRWLMHPSQDAYWQHMVAYKADFSKINIPVLTMTGYFDDDQLGAMYYFNQHHLYNKNAMHYLLIGPYDHGGAQGFIRSTIGAYKLDSVANININQLTYQWFDFILKDSVRPIFLKDKINFEVMGSNKWKHVSTLSGMNNDTIQFYLSNIRLDRHYKLDTQLPKEQEYIRQEIDFKDRSDSVQANSGNIIDSALDLTNGLSFKSKPFDKDFEINGSFLGELKLGINKRDLDLSVSIYEQMKDGKYFQLGSYMVRASYAKDREKRQLLQPDRMETVPVNNSFFTSRKISAGSKLVIVLSIVKNPQWQINYGTGKDVSDETIADASIPLEIKWYNTSVIRIPVWK